MFFVVAEMASKFVDFNQNGDYVYASIKADPHVKEYSAVFSDNGFIITVDG